MSQGVINWLLWLWTSGHDFVYMAIYWVLIHFHVIKPSKGIEDRLAALEKKWGIGPDV